MRICKVYDADYPWDIRVEKITDSLIQHGHEVHLVCRNLKRSPGYECSEQLHIHRLPGVDNPTLNYAISFPAIVCRQRLWDRYSAGLRESFCSS